MPSPCRILVFVVAMSCTAEPEGGGGGGTSDLTFLEGDWGRDCLDQGGGSFLGLFMSIRGRTCESVTTSFSGGCAEANVTTTETTTCSFEVVGPSAHQRFAWDIDSVVTHADQSTENRYDIALVRHDIDFGADGVHDALSFGAVPGATPEDRPTSFGTALYRLSGARRPLPHWTPPAYEVYPELTTMSRFGDRVAIDGACGVVSARYKEADAIDAFEDAVYFLEQTGGRWGVVARFRGEGGSVVSISGTSAAALSSAGVQLYERVGGVWTEGALVASTTSPLYVVLSGTRMVIGEPYADFDTFNDAGQIVVYEKSGGTWSPAATLRAAVPENGGELGGPALGLDGDRIVAASPDHGVLVFDFDGTDWIESAMTGHGFTPEHLLVDGERVLLAQEQTGDSRMQIMSHASGAWVSEMSYGSMGVEYGRNDIALSGDRAVVGTNANQLYLFTWDGDSWARSELATPKDVEVGDDYGGLEGLGNQLLGSHVGLSGNRLIVGAPGAVFEAGAVYVFDLP